MESSSFQPHIGFPAPLLGERPFRLSVLHREGGLLAIDKPSGILACPHDWYPGQPSLLVGINRQARSEKPEIKRLGVRKTFPVIPLEAELSGVALFGTSSKAAGFFRNQHGSYGMRFTFLLLAREFGHDLKEEIDCQLPMTGHSTKARLVVSHRRGKRSRTNFSRKARMGSFSLWKAETDYYRVHMVRLHAVESGLGIVGDPLYGQVKSIYLSQLKRDYRASARRKEQPLYSGLCLHLATVSITDEEGNGRVIESNLPDPWQVLLKKLEIHSPAVLT